MLLDRIPHVIPDQSLPESVRHLAPLRFNFRWTWHPATRELLEQTDLCKLVDDHPLRPQAEELLKELQAYLHRSDTWASRPGLSEDRPVAYFCAEYGLHESFPLYCGGLGILAGDHCKEASDMALPFVAIGLFYRRGFFTQVLDHEGRQEHLYPTLRPEQQPVARVLDSTGNPLLIEVPYPGRTVYAAVWLAAVGRTPLLLLDTDVYQNAPEDRPITSQLYMLGRDMRIHQELMLGVGGMRALKALGIDPGVVHMNEGHSALLLIERLRDEVLAGASFADACKKVASESILTIHTPVPEGNERFDAGEVGRLLGPILAGTEIGVAQILKMGLDSKADPTVFDMTAFALRVSRAANGVSLLHGKTADGTWRKTAGRKVIGVTNGVHMPTWLGPQMRGLYEKAGLNLNVETNPDRQAGKSRATWEAVEQIDDSELLAAHRDQKRTLVQFATARMKATAARYGYGPDRLRAIEDQLDPDAFIIGFARRFAPYKRAALLFSDERRLLKMLKAKGRKVQLIFAGKAHPGDRNGQKLIAEVFKKTQSPKFAGHVFLLEDYDMEVGRHLVQGVDLWLNNPRRPLEASGTSGMKAAANGAPNCSILDGWWDEAFEGGKKPNGFAIGGRKNTDDKEDAEALYRVLEQEVLPAYFEGGSRWPSLMKRAIATSVWAFSTARMIEDYADEMYWG